MTVWELLLIAFSVSLDAFALSVAGALTSTRSLRRNALLAAGFFGGFQFLMPLLGFAVASVFQKRVEAYDHWIAFALLALVGGKMVYEGVRRKDPENGKTAVTEFFDWKLMFVPAVATSLDALAVGATLALSGGSVLIPALAMGVVTAAVCASGVWFGRKLAALAEARMLSIIGGCVVILVGANILRQHLGV